MIISANLFADVIAFESIKEEGRSRVFVFNPLIIKEKGREREREEEKHGNR